MVRLNFLALLALGAAQFSWGLFLTRYFEFVSYTSLSGAALFISQLICLWGNSWQRGLPLNRWIALPTLAACYIALSNAHIGMPHLVLASAAAVSLLINQWCILRLFRDAESIRQAYSIELIGGVCGVLLWYFGSVHLGFIGFVGVQLLAHGIFWLGQPASIGIKALTLGAFIASLFFIREPLPILDKFVKFNFGENKKLVTLSWNPNAHVALIESKGVDAARTISFDGGSYNSSVPKIEGNFQISGTDIATLRKRYFWALDVALPHMLLKERHSKVALISAVGGQEVIAAKAFNASKIWTIDINGSAQTFAGPLSRSFNSDLFSSDVEVLTGDGRKFIESARSPFDVIQIYSAFNAIYTGLVGLATQPSRLVTIESLRAYVEKLTPGGILHVSQPFREKILSTFTAAFDLSGAKKNHPLLVIRRDHTGPSNLKYGSFLFKKGGWSDAEVDSIETFLAGDKLDKWHLVVDPRADFKREPLNVLPPATDNKPFPRLTSPPLELTSLRICIVALVLLLALSLGQVLHQTKVAKGVGVNALLFGVTYSWGQNIIIVMFQGKLGEPALGLSLGLVFCLCASILGTAMQQNLSKGKNRSTGNVLVACLALVLSGLSGFPNFTIVSMILLFLLVTLQSARFAEILRGTRLHTNYIFWVNGLGFAIGFLLFNLSYVIFGFAVSTTLVASFYGLSLLTQCLGQVGNQVLDVLNPH